MSQEPDINALDILCCSKNGSYFVHISHTLNKNRELLTSICHVSLVYGLDFYFALFDGKSVCHRSTWPLSELSGGQDSHHIAIKQYKSHTCPPITRIAPIMIKKVTCLSPLKYHSSIQNSNQLKSAAPVYAVL